MSEYQFYEFQAIDRPLTEAQMAEIRKLSSRVELSTTRASFVYHYGDFRGNPLEVLEKHFDVMLYITNWGSRQLAFRFPRSALDLQPLMPYYWGIDAVEVTTTERHVILNINFHEVDEGRWIEDDEVTLGSMALLRQDILRGDLRLLYLAWLKGAPNAGDDEPWDEDDEADDDEADTSDDGDLHEPPVPAGLAKLSAPLREYASFIELDPDLIDAAAQASAPLQAETDAFEAWIPLLPEAERNAFLARVARGEPLVEVALNRRLREVGGGSGASRASTDMPRRTISELLAAAQETRRQRKERERAEAQRARKRQLEALALREAAAWTEARALIERKNARAYEEAVALLIDLRDLADHRRTRADFNARVAALHQEFASRPSLIERLRVARLIPK